MKNHKNIKLFYQYKTADRVFYKYLKNKYILFNIQNAHM